MQQPGILGKATIFQTANSTKSYRAMYVQYAFLSFLCSKNNQKFKETSKVFPHVQVLREWPDRRPPCSPSGNKLIFQFGYICPERNSHSYIAPMTCAFLTRKLSRSVKANECKSQAKTTFIRHAVRCYQCCAVKDSDTEHNHDSYVIFARVQPHMKK